MGRCQQLEGAMAKRLMIPPPHCNKYEPERFADCQKAIEDGLLELLGVAIDAGWGKAEVIAAVIAVAENTQLAQDKFVGPSVALYLKKLSKKRD
jgi:hypothetical protein